MSDKAAGQKTRSPEGCDENGPAAALVLSHVSIQICSFVAPCRRPLLIATPLHQSLTWCTSLSFPPTFEKPDFLLEFRDPSWMDEEVFGVLRQHGVANTA